MFRVLNEFGFDPIQGYLNSYLSSIRLPPNNTINQCANANVHIWTDCLGHLHPNLDWRNWFDSSDIVRILSNFFLNSSSEIDRDINQEDRTRNRYFKIVNHFWLMNFIMLIKRYLIMHWWLL